MLVPTRRTGGSGIEGAEVAARARRSRWWTIVASSACALFYVANVPAFLFARKRIHGASVESVSSVPIAAQELGGPPIEEVLFLRDEMSNLAWAVERLIESPAERTLNRFEAYLEQKRRREPDTAVQITSAPETLRYRLSTEVPDYWIPLMPVRVGQGLRLQRGAVLKTDGSLKNVQLSLFEEEVPREGVRVTRSYQYTRWFDGSTHLWVGRRKQIGRGEGSSGLRFDFVWHGP